MLFNVHSTGLYILFFRAEGLISTPIYFVSQRDQGGRKHERRHQGEISEDRTRRGRRALLAGLSAGPHLAVRLDLARWSGRLLFPDDLRDLCGAGHLFDRCGKEPWRKPQPHLFHNLVKRRACRNHGNAGAFRQWRAQPSRGRCSGIALNRRRLVGALAEGGTVHQGDRLTVIGRGSHPRTKGRAVLKKLFKVLGIFALTIAGLFVILALYVFEIDSRVPVELLSRGRVYVDQWDQGYVSAKGTWASDQEGSVDPLNVSDIRLVR